MSAALQKLNFIVSMIDKVSSPAGKMMKKMDTVTTSIQSGYQKIGYGAAGLVGAGYSLERLLEPAKEMRTALGTISSLGVEQTALASLRKEAQRTAVEFGGDAIEIITASYKLQSAISGIKGNELGMLVNKSTLLATATKGSLESTNAYVGQMFNIHELNAKAIGKTAFMDELISKTAKAVQLFNTDGEKMGEAMKNIGKQATAMKVPLGEQLAVMGFLQNTMIEGSRSGTAYLSFLSNIGKAETTLGMKFTNSQGAVLPMVDIIAKLEAKFGDLSKAADQGKLQKAFGKRGQAVISAMAGSMGTFSGHLDKINKANGLDDIMKMAQEIRDPWDKSAAAVNNFRVNFGEKLLVYMIPVYNKITEITSTMTKWMDMFPNLTGWIAKGTLTIISLIAAMSLLSIAVGVNKFLMVGWGVAFSTLKFAFIAMKFSLLTVIPAVWGFTSALLANPITWIVLGVTALIAVIIAAVVYWKEWTTVIFNFGSRFLEMIGIFAAVEGALIVWDTLKQWWTQFAAWLGSLNPFSFIGEGIDWLIDKINLIPGIDISTATDAPKPIAAPASLNPNVSRGNQGGVINQISNASNANSSRSIGDVHVNNYGQPMNGQTLRDEMEFAAG